MEPEQPPRKSQDLARLNVSANAKGEQDETKAVLIDPSAVNKLVAENARLEGDVAKVLPESPWYVAILIVALVGVLAGILFLNR